MLKNIMGVLVVLLACSGVCQADEQPQMPQVNMAQMQQVGVCMSQIDQGKMAALMEEGKAFMEKNRALCKEGKRDAAQENALAYHEKMQGNPTVKAMKKCSEMLDVPMDSPEDSLVDIDPEKEGHICDTLE